MSLSVGIVGLPNVGKSTLFQALTKKSVDIANYPFCTIDPNVGVVQVPDERLDQIHESSKTPKKVPTIIEFVDIAGIIKGAHQGEGLGNKFLTNIRETDAICHVTRVFEDEKIHHVSNNIDPKEDIETINMELIMKDLETVEKRLEKTEKQARSGDKKMIAEFNTLKEIKASLERGEMINKLPIKSDPLVKELCLISAKPMVYLLNIKENTPIPALNGISPVIPLNLQNELDSSSFSEEEKKELNLNESRMNELITACYKSLNLITFYTTGGPESRAWTIKRGSTAPQAGSAIHGDFEEKFIKAEVIDWKSFIEIGSWQKAREKGLLRTEGKEYIVQDGDIIEFKV